MVQAFGCLQVDQSNVIIREHFGKFDDVLEPGCHCLTWRLGYQMAGGLSLRVQQLYVRCETKTKDNVFVTVVASVQYRAVADKAPDAFYRLTNTGEQIQSYVFDVIRASVPKLNLDAVFEQKNDIAKSVDDELEKAMSTYGYEIVQTLIVDIEHDPHVKRAMNEINAVLSIFDPEAAASARAQLDGVDEVDRQAHGKLEGPGDDFDLEAQGQPPGLEANEHYKKDEHRKKEEDEHRKKDWNNAMLAFCMASSMALALLPVQLHSQFQSSLQCLALALLLGFTSFFLSVFIHAKFVAAVRLLQKCGQFFTATAFFMAISLQFSLVFKCTSWAVYFISFLGIVISSFFKA